MFGAGKLLHVFGGIKSLNNASPRLHLFDKKKYSKTILLNMIIIQNNCN